MKWENEEKTKFRDNYGSGVLVVTKITASFDKMAYLNCETAVDIE